MRYSLLLVQSIALMLCSTFAAAAAGGVGEEDAARPKGKNCELTTAPTEAGEEINHNYLIRVYPRRSAIPKDFTGCQVIFMGLPSAVPEVAWLVYVVKGDPVRTWSPHKELAASNQCRYSSGALIGGSPEKCPDARLLLMPSMPAGCYAQQAAAERCRHDMQ